MNESKSIRFNRLCIIVQRISLLLFNIFYPTSHYSGCSKGRWCFHQHRQHGASSSTAGRLGALLLPTRRSARSGAALPGWGQRIIFTQQNAQDILTCSQFKIFLFLPSHSWPWWGERRERKYSFIPWSLDTQLEPELLEPWVSHALQNIHIQKQHKRVWMSECRFVCAALFLKELWAKGWELMKSGRLFPSHWE